VTRSRTCDRACGRSSEGASTPVRLSRCDDCGGTMLVEPVARLTMSFGRPGVR
jgi:hypothetical protein